MNIGFNMESKKGQIGAGLTWIIATIAILIIVIIFIAATFFIATKHVLFNTPGYDEEIIVDGGNEIRGDLVSMQNLISFLKKDIILDEEPMQIVDILKNYIENQNSETKQLIVDELEKNQFCFKEFGGSDKFITGYALGILGNNAHFEQDKYSTFKKTLKEIDEDLLFVSESFNVKEKELTNLAFLIYPDSDGKVISFNYFQTSRKYKENFGEHIAC